MKLIVEQSRLKGEIVIPPSKSHTIRAIVIALLAKGQSIIRNPLQSEDCLAALTAAEALGAKVERKRSWTIKGRNGKIKAKRDEINVCNSGTTLRLMASIAALQDKEITFDGDESIKSRPMQPLLQALQNLGAEVKSEEGCAPLSIKGPISAGSIMLSGKSSQYVTSMLLAAPLLESKTTLQVYELNEKPYVDMTLKWLAEQKIRFKEKSGSFLIEGNQRYNAFTKRIPADWSSAAFPLVAAAITNSKVSLLGLDYGDIQGDKRIIDFLRETGSDIQLGKETVIKPEELRGIKADLNNTPDLLPIMAVLGCFSQGSTTLSNVGHARIKESDRIAAMAKELKKMGALIEETPNGLVIERCHLNGAVVDGQNDHRVIMALACAGMAASGTTTIMNANNLDASFPGFIQKMQALGANLTMEEQ
ncbi:3-phosphoshikimate 1-carboxyvinyltransferase [Candidatus Woesearchaeota archaeon]|nr:3-phosphoshikimate 1-carboxyvinyltransferase [Candidatus Woesearchaeota archaeon]